MPLFKEIKENSLHLLLWKIEEPLDFFEENTCLTDAEKLEFDTFKNIRRKKEWLATRYVLKQIIGDKQYLKNKEGKPILIHNEGYISISHCKGFAAVAFNKKIAVGIDIEPIHEKIARVAHKFLSPKELNLIEKNDSYLNDLTKAWVCKESIYKKYKIPGISFSKNIEVNFSSQGSDQFTDVILKENDKLSVTKVRSIIVESCILAYTL